MTGSMNALVVQLMDTVDRLEERTNRTDDLVVKIDHMDKGLRRVQDEVTTLKRELGSVADDMRKLREDNGTTRESLANIRGQLEILNKADVNVTAVGSVGRDANINNQDS